MSGNELFRVGYSGVNVSPWWHRTLERMERRKVPRPCANAGLCEPDRLLNRQVLARSARQSLNRAHEAYENLGPASRAIANGFHRNLRHAANKRAVYLVYRKWQMPFALRQYGLMPDFKISSLCFTGTLSGSLKSDGYAISILDLPGTSIIIVLFSISKLVSFKNGNVESRVYTSVSHINLSNLSVSWNVTYVISKINPTDARYARSLSTCVLDYYVRLFYTSAHTTSRDQIHREWTIVTYIRVSRKYPSRG